MKGGHGLLLVWQGLHGLLNGQAGLLNGAAELSEGLGRGVLVNRLDG